MKQKSVHLVEDRRPLDAGLFSFYEYDTQLDKARRALGNAKLRVDTPQVDILEDATFVPFAPPEVGRGKRQSTNQPLQAGIVGRDGQVLANANLRRGERRLIAGLTESTDLVPASAMDEEVVYLGWLFDHHYGHFLLESLARVWALQELDPSVRVVFHSKDPAKLKPGHWSVRILAAFGIPWERILLPDAPTRFRRIVVPEPLFEMGNAHERAAAPHRAVASQIVGDARPSTQPVYLSRRLLSGPGRQTIGEAELEDVLRENGFLVVHPEKMRFEDQVRLINGHTDIFATTGSAAHNVLFALHRPRLHLLTSAAFPLMSYFICSALAEAPTAFVSCLELGARSHAADEGQRRRLPEVVAMPTLVEYLDEQRFLRSRVRASLAGRNPAIQDEYDEAWFYTSVGAARRGETFPAELESETVNFARSSWPVSFALAGLYIDRRDSARLDPMVQQFATLVAPEFDMNRLAYYRAEVERVAPKLSKRCQPDTAKRLAQVVSDRFHIQL